MSIVIVTGLGPRTGTSFIMQKAIEKGIPIHGHKFIPEFTIEKHNPSGYWETPIYDNTINNCLVKLWYPSVINVKENNIAGIVALERQNKLAQIASIYKVFKDECRLNSSFYLLDSPSSFLLPFIANTNNWLSRFNKQKVMRVYTEDLTSSLQDILSFIERGLTCQQQS